MYRITLTIDGQDYVETFATILIAGMAYDSMKAQATAGKIERWDGRKWCPVEVLKISGERPRGEAACDMN